MNGLNLPVTDVNPSELPGGAPQGRTYDVPILKEPDIIIIKLGRSQLISFTGL